MCHAGWCLSGVLGVTLHVLRAAQGGDTPEQAVCSGLSRHFDVTVAAVITLDPSAHTATITAWPHTVDVLRLRTVVDRLPQAFPLLMRHLLVDRHASCLSRDADTTIWPAAIGALLLRELFDCLDIAQVPLAEPDPRLRIAVLASPRRYDERALHLLESLREPLAVVTELLDRAPGPTPGELTNPGLTSRELEVLRMLAEGLLARTIATRLEVSPRTVHKHLGNVYRKLEAHDRLAAVRQAEHLGLVTAPAGRDRAPRPGSALGGREPVTLRW